MRFCQTERHFGSLKLLSPLSKGGDWVGDSNGMSEDIMKEESSRLRC